MLVLESVCGSLYVLVKREARTLSRRVCLGLVFSVRLRAEILLLSFLDDVTLCAEAHLPRPFFIALRQLALLLVYFFIPSIRILRMSPEFLL